MARISKDEILATFRRLVAEGVIIHGPHTVVHHDEEGYPLEFRICPSLLRKPHAVGASLDPSFGGSRKWGPGSDMYLSDERLIITKLNGTHDLTFNLFAVDDAQLMMLTCDSYRRQYEPLDIEDFEAALRILRDLDDVYVIYNGGQNAGCSRMHKHLQGLKGPPYAFDVLVSDSAKVPFEYFKHHFQDGFESTPAQEIVNVYQGLLGRSRAALGLKGEEEPCPHNVVMWRDWLLVIPRSHAYFEGTSGNAAGMCGSPWVPEQRQVDEWMRLGPGNVLRALGVPRTDGEPQSS